MALFNMQPFPPMAQPWEMMIRLGTSNARCEHRWTEVHVGFGETQIITNKFIKFQVLETGLFVTL